VDGRLTTSTSEGVGGVDFMYLSVLQYHFIALCYFFLSISAL
jgi:hypothetical protein